LLEGFKPPEKPAPELPLGETPPNIVELGMGLPVGQVRGALNRFFGGGKEAGKEAKWWQRSPTILNRGLGKAPNGKGMGDLLYDARKVSDVEAGIADIALRDSGLQTLTEAEDFNLMQVLDRHRARPMNARVQKAASILEPWSEGIGLDYEARGAKVMKPAIYDTKTGAELRGTRWKLFQRVQGGYYAHSSDARLVDKLSSGQLASDLAKSNPSFTAVEATDMAVALQAQARGQAIPKTVSEPIRQLLRQGQPGAGFLHERSGWNMPDSIMMRPKSLLPRYAESAAKETGFLHTFGPGDKLVEDAIMQAKSAGRRDAGLAQQEWDALRGRAVKSAFGEGVDKVARLGQNIATATLLGPKTALKQLSQIGMAFGSDIRTRSLLKGSAEAFSQHGIDAAKVAGAVTDGIRTDMELAGRLHSQFLPSDNWLDKAVKVTGRVANVVVDKTMITTMDSLGRSLAFHGAKQDFLLYQRAAAKGKASAVAKLKEFGLIPTSTLQEVETMASNMADKINLRADSLEIPAFFYRTPGLSAVKHLNNFNLVMTRKIATEYIAPLGRALADGDKAEIMKQLKRSAKFGVAMTVTGEGLGDLLTTIEGRPDDRPGGTLADFVGGLARGEVSRKTILNRVGSDLLTAGTFGYLQAIQGAIYATGGAKDIQSRLTSAVVGAPTGSVLEAGSHLAALATADTEPSPRTGRSKADNARREALRATVRRLPGVGQLAVGLLPASPGSDRRRAINGWVREKTKGNDGMEWLDWYRERQGKSIDPKKLYEALDD
jgi:hypothetical protein